MSETQLPYDLMVEDALRGVVRRALEVVASRGLPGNHHFYITFRTDHPGVKLPAYLRERYPSEMTIVLQYQFWGLEVREADFQVTLSFNDKPERLVIPLEAVKAFADPSVRFGLQFDSLEDDEEEGDGEENVADLKFDSEIQSRSIAGAPEQDGAPKDDQADGKEDEATSEADEDSAEPAAKVVTLDAFRKK